MVLGLPLAPFRGLRALLEVLRDQADEELYDPSRLRRQAEEIDALEASGQITAAEAEQRHEQLLEHLLVVPRDSLQGRS